MNDTLKEAKKLAVILRDLCEGGGPEEDVDIYSPDFCPPDGDVFVIRAAQLLEQLASAVPFGYFHELLDYKGEGEGVWLGCDKRDVVEKSYTEGETGTEIVTLYKMP